MSRAHGGSEEEESGCAQGDLFGSDWTSDEYFQLGRAKAPTCVTMALEAEERPGRPWWRAAALGTAFALAVAGATTTLSRFDTRTLSGSEEMRGTRYDFGSCESGGPWEDKVSSCEVWNTSSAGGGGADTLVHVNELIVATGAYSPYLYQAYASWRYLQNGVIGEALGGVFDDAERDVQISVTSRKVKKEATLAEMLAGGSVPTGTVVFVDVIGNVDTSHDKLVMALAEEEHVSPRDVAAGCADAPWNLFFDKCLADLDAKCVYINTEDLLLRVAMLRRLLSYEKPLVLVVTGDIACRLRLPETHHRVLLANDGACRQAETMQSRSDVQAWPQGLEDFTDESEAQSFAAAVKNVVDRATDESESVVAQESRDLLVSASFSYYFRKPARVALHNYLAEQGGAERLAQLGLVSFQDEVNTGFNTTDSWTFGMQYPSQFASNRTLFTLCPAGDIWSSGRILEAMLLGSVPVVDMTYERDGGKSAKGCHEPAAMFRESDAPFLFLSDWNDLPDKLHTALADPDFLSKRSTQVLKYARKLARQARARVLDFALRGARGVQHKTTCVETPINGSQWRSIKLDAAQYYKSTGTTLHRAAWFHEYVDNPSVPGCGCSTKAYFSLNGAFCFDAACAPPLVADFQCAPIEDMVNSVVSSDSHQHRAA